MNKEWNGTPAVSRRRMITGAVFAVAVAASVAPLLVPDAEAAATRVFTGIDVRATGDGYLLGSARGEMYAFGGAAAVRNPSGFTGDIVDVALTADGRGAMAVSSAGQFYASGTATPQRNPSGFSGRIVGVALTADGKGAMAVSSAGQFYAYGTARAQPNPSGFTGEIVDLALTADGQGAMAVSSAGQFYAYGTATAQPNPSGFTGRIVGLSLTADGRGAMALSSAGQFYAYGTATAQANPRDFAGEMIALDLTADGRGVVALSSTGQVYASGTARYHGNGDSGCTSFAGRAVCHDIRARYQALGGAGGPLGAPTSGEFGVVDGGLGQHFTSGSIYWSPRTGAWDVRGVIRDKWFSMAAERGLLGMPVGGEFFADGRWGSRFANGSIYFSGATGAHEVHGEIHRVYAANNYAEGALRMPLTDEVDGAGDWAGGKASFFVGGTIVWDGRSTRVREPSSADRRAEARTLQAMSLDDFMAVQRGVDKSGNTQWESDGCSGPTGGELDDIFEPACIRHDFGSRSFGPRNLRLDTSEASFNRVNDIFRKDLMSICTRHGNPWVSNGDLPPVRCGLAADATHRTVVAARRVWWDA
ncbi:phospholipase A2 [Actinoplanes xinjiangensis]|nr:phospholipase A2 [Actinoplanes xinjiangensis]